MAVQTPALIRAIAPTGEKSQLVRLMDVFVFGPLMIQASRTQEKNYFRTALFLIGIGTILYNGVNYLETQKKEREADQLGDLGQRLAPHPGRLQNPLTPKGEKILAAMRQTYGYKPGTEVFYASEQAGTITGTH